MVNHVIRIDDLLLIVIHIPNTFSCIVQIVAEGWSM
jgi:hypothetical protein